MEQEDKNIEKNENEPVNNAEEQSHTGRGDSAETDTVVAELTEKLAELQDKYLRQAAEFDNHRKRTLKEKYELVKTAGEDVIKELLPVIDDFDRALEAIAQSGDTALTEGVKLIYDKLLSALGRKGLSNIDSTGADFDPEVHDAVAKVTVPAEQKGKVTNVVQKGYSLNEKIIRHPKVVVGE